MARAVYVAKMIDGEFRLVPAEEYVPESDRAAGPQVITDLMEPTWHPATGEHISSKSRFRRRTREAGLEEIGNERIKPKDHYAEMRATLKSDLLNAYDYAESRTRRR